MKLLNQIIIEAINEKLLSMIDIYASTFNIITD